MTPEIVYSTYYGGAYRAFHTAYPSQELVDDLVDTPREEAILKTFYYESPDVAARAPTRRVLSQSAQTFIQSHISEKFSSGRWYVSRFSDGSWPVLYAAQEEATALAECLYHARLDFYREELRERDVMIDLRIISLTLASDRAVDVTGAAGADRTQLTSQDRSGYAYCQAMAKRCREAGAHLLQTPSARYTGGTCLPIFEETAIRKDHGHLRYAKCILSRHGARLFQEYSP